MTRAAALLARLRAETGVWLAPAAPLGRRLAAVAAVVSPLGRTVLVASVAVWLAGWWAGWRELLVLAAAGPVLVLLAMVYTIGAADLRIDLEVTPRRIEVGTDDGATGSLTITNQSRRPLLPLRVELPIGPVPLSVDVPMLMPGRTKEEPFVIATARRGVVVVGPAWSVRGDPLGLLRRAVRWTDPLEVFVRPRTTRLAPLAAGFQRDLDGQPTRELSNSDVAFHALRPYVTGDDPRHVHWRTVARTRTLMVRQFLDTRTASVAVLLSCAASDYAPADPSVPVSDGDGPGEREFELAVSVAASVAVRALDDGLSLSLLAGTEVPARAGRQHLLDSLCRVALDPAGPGLDRLTVRARRVAPAASVVVLVTGSGTSPAALRAWVSRFAGPVRVLTICAAPGRPTQVSPLAGTDLIVVPELAALPAVLRKAVQR